MSIKKFRSLLKGNDLKDFDTTLSKFKMSNNVNYKMLDYQDSNNFTIRSEYNTYPKNVLLVFKNGEPAEFAFY